MKLDGGFVVVATVIHEYYIYILQTTCVNQGTVCGVYHGDNETTVETIID